LQGREGSDPDDHEEADYHAERDPNETGDDASHRLAAPAQSALRLGDPAASPESEHDRHDSQRERRELDKAVSTATKRSQRC